MIKLVWRTDVHLSDTPPVSRKDDWAATVLGKLAQVGAIAAQEGASAVIDGGDFFHVKSPSRNTHDLIRRVADVHKAYPCPVLGNVGNHDCVYGDYTYLNQQPLGVLFSTDVFLRNYDEYEFYFGPADLTSRSSRAYPYNRKTGAWASGNPFDYRQNLHVPIVRVVGVPYHGTTYDMGRFLSLSKGDEAFLFCHAHVLASPTGGSMFEAEDIVKYDALNAFAPDVMAFGHWHKDQGVTTLSSGKTVINIGSLTRGALSQDEVERKPGVAVLKFERGKPVQVDVRRLEVGKASDVFDMAGRARAVERTSTVNAFAESVRARLEQEKGRTVEESVAGMDLPDKVRERVLSYLERVG